MVVTVVDLVVAGFGALPPHLKGDKCERQFVRCTFSINSVGSAVFRNCSCIHSYTDPLSTTQKCTGVEVTTNSGSVYTAVLSFFF